MCAKPLVAIVGRPNVGKSTLFNRLAGQPLAIVSDVPGTTRDRIYADAEWSGRAFSLVDTGGLEPSRGTDMADQIHIQAELAMDQADVIIFLVDARDGITATDEEIADILRARQRNVVVAANKADNERRRLDVVEFYQLGLSDPIPISAIHGDGVGDLLDAVAERFPKGPVEEEEAAVKIAIVGRPNVGKSSLLNALVGQQRAIVTNVPGTTRDALDTVIEDERGRFLLIDTAGIRRRGKVERGIEHYSVIRALRAIDRADVAFLVIDSVDGISAQDQHIAGYILEAYKGVIVAMNKWDAVAKGPRTTDEYTGAVREALNFMAYVPVIFISAKTGQRVERLLDMALAIKEERRRRVPTGVLNQTIQEFLARHAPPTEAGRPLRIYYVTQAGIEPPTFVFFVNDARMVHFSYQRYLDNQLRETFGFDGTPIKLVFKTRESKAKE